MRAPRRLLAPAALFVCATLLTGCVTIVAPETAPSRAPLTAAPDPAESAPQSPSPIPSPTSVPDDDVIACAGAPVLVQAGPEAHILEGDCPSVTVEGNDGRVHLVDAEVGALVVRGDRMDIAAGNVESIEIGGQDNHAVAVGVGVVTVRGDRNVVDVSDAVESATVNGNDNVVTAQSIDAVVVSGGGNQVGSR